MNLALPQQDGAVVVQVVQVVGVLLLNAQVAELLGLLQHVELGVQQHAVGVVVEQDAARVEHALPQQPVQRLVHGL